MEHLGETDGKPDNVVIKTESASAAVVDYQNACRLCLCIIESKSDATEIISVFSIFEDFLQYCHLAMTLANIKIEEHDCLPKRLCDECRSNLARFYNFKRKCEYSDRTLNEIYQTNVKPDIEANCVDMCTTLFEENFDNDKAARVDEKYGSVGVLNLPNQHNEKDIFESDSDECAATTKKRKKHKKSNRAKQREATHETDEPKALNTPKEKTRKVCEQCGLTFSSNCTLRRHRITHTGQKDFVCDICSNRFARKFHLDMHMRIHLKIRPHICETCASSFSTSSDLSRHRRIHVDVKNYACVVCERRFKRSSDVVKHMRSHTGQKPYSCKSCDKKYTSHSGLTKHLRRHHPQVVVDRVNKLNEIKAKEQEIIEQRYENKLDASIL